MRVTLKVCPNALNVTVPVGTPAPGATGDTVTVTVSNSPVTGALSELVTLTAVAARWTTWVSDWLLEAKFAAPLYVAVRPCEPTARAVVVNVATPDQFTGAVPSVVDPSVNVTVPVGVPAPGATTDTVAVRVTACPNTDALADETNWVVVAAGFTACVRAAEVLEAKLGSPL